MSYVIDDEIKFGYMYTYSESSGEYRPWAGDLGSGYSIKLVGTDDAGFSFRTSGGYSGTELWWRRLNDGKLICSNSAQTSGANTIYGFDTPGTVTYNGASYTCRFATAKPSGSDVQGVLASMPRAALPNRSYCVYMDPTNYTKSGGNGVISTSKSYTWKVGTKSVKTGADYHYTTETATFMPLIMIPSGATPVVSIDQQTIGVISDPDGVTATCTQTCTAALWVDNSQYGTFQMTANIPTVVPLSNAWAQITKNVEHTLKVVTTLNGYTCEDKRTFTKKEAQLDVRGVAVTVPKRPVACSVLTIIDHAPGEVATLQVCNNGNDQSPSWETYEGDEHYFANDMKDADDWAVNWRYMVDATSATGGTTPGIKTKVGMGVVYAETD